MRVSDAYPSPYLKAEQIGDEGSVLDVTIKQVEFRDVSGKGQRSEHKLVLGFHEVGPELVLNKTNASQIENLYGPETDDWVGKRLTLYVKEVEFQGDLVYGIRVKRKPPAAASKGSSPEAPKTLGHKPVSEDDIPF